VIEGTDGNFYGTTVNGGSGLYGSAFKMYPGGTLYVLHSFTNGVDGATPLAGLIQASDGNFYGASLHGVGASLGTLFRMSPINATTAALTPLHGFGGGDDGGNCMFHPRHRLTRQCHHLGRATGHTQQHYRRGSGHPFDGERQGVFILLQG
jgi:uncharacterized repeat protein (TIGR03803 family)